jgi:ABC-type nickel/cobalt efflux system permease component RcnA
MPDWIIGFLSGVQRAIVTTLAAELRAGGLATAAFAFFLGAVHALTPGHGKAAVAAYFFGQQSRIATGIRVALGAAFLHVLMGFAAFLVLRFIVNQMPAMTGRGSPALAITGYGLIVVAGALMILQSLRSTSAGARAHVLTVGIGLLPCPLTITVLGFAWAQGVGPMTAVVLFSLAAGIAFTIGIVAVLAILGRRFLGQALNDQVPGFERAARTLQGAAGALIIVIAAYAIWTSI